MVKKIVGAAVVLGIVGGVYLFFSLLTNNKLSLGYNINYEPDQPIPYSHELHAGKLKIDCKYCHTSTEESRHASVPSLNICMNCHLTVKTDSPHIQTLMEHYNSGKPVEWQKVHLLPDHVKFNHAAHMLSGKIGEGKEACFQCHGQVDTMEKVKQVHDLSMGWCVSCHRKPEHEAPTTCGTCHY